MNYPFLVVNNNNNIYQRKHRYYFLHTYSMLGSTMNLLLILSNLQNNTSCVPLLKPIAQVKQQKKLRGKESFSSLHIT